uniref:Exocyst complex component EXO70B1 n=1 Tax=Tanacetum cinerariifolium TaxID=118510 RepID=A0A6L2NU62_TANCI|nr:exocyst complex component EXO70B1 [Tanacetum cinerariifolium]
MSLGGSNTGIEEDFNRYREEFYGSGRMIRVRYEKECCQVYSNVRRNVLDECLVILGVEKLSIEEVVCFDLTDVPVGNPPDSLLAPQWYRLEGGDDPNAADLKCISRRNYGILELLLWKLKIAVNLPPLTAPEVRVKAQLGFQSVRTRRGSVWMHPRLSFRARGAVGYFS